MKAGSLRRRRSRRRRHAVTDISSTVVAARALEGTAFVAMRVAGEEGGGRNNQH